MTSPPSLAYQLQERKLDPVYRCQCLNILDYRGLAHVVSGYLRLDARECERTNSFMNLFNYTFSSNPVDFACFHDGEPAVAIMFVVTKAAESGSDTSMDVRIVFKQTF